MDELGKWFLEVFTSVNGGGRLGPPVASKKRFESFLEQVGGESVLKLAAMLNVGNAEVVSKLAASKPDLGEWLAGDEPQKALDRYFAERADALGKYRKFVTMGLSLKISGTMACFADPGDSQTAVSEAWEKVFQIISGSANDD